MVMMWSNLLPHRRFKIQENLSLSIVEFQIYLFRILPYLGIIWHYLLLNAILPVFPAAPGEQSAFVSAGLERLDVCYRRPL